MPTLNEKTRISLPVKAVYTLAICFASATFWLAGIYSEARDLRQLPARISALEEKQSLQKDICKVVKRIQEMQIPKKYQEEIDCK